MTPDPDIPPEYTPEEWQSYQRDPCSWCIKELSNPDPNIRCNAADILRGLAQDAEAAIPALIEGFNDSDQSVRAYCIHAMVDIGYALMGRASSAVPALASLLHDKSAEIRTLAAHALGAIGPSAEAAAHELRHLHTDTDENVRGAAEAALAKIEIK